MDHKNSSPKAPSRVVVLGGSGFVGANLVAHLDRNGTNTVSLSSADIDLSQSDAPTKLKKKVSPDDALVVVSALTPDKGRDIRTLMKNLEMMEQVSNFVQDSACSHIVYISSDAVYHDNANPVTESSCCEPSGFHGVMHLARERMLTHSAQQADIPLAVLRPSLLFGPGDTHNGYGPNRFMRTAKADGKITLFGQGEEKRDHVYIADLSRLIGLALSHKSAGVLNVATQTSTSFWDVANIVSKLNGGTVEIECLPRSSAITHRHFDMAETHRAFPSFKYTALDEALSEVFGTTKKAAQD